MSKYDLKPLKTSALDSQAFFEGKGLEQMFYVQKDLMYHLHKADKLIAIEYDINERESQEHFRTLVYYLIEELAELQEALETHQLKHQNFNSIFYEHYIKSLENINEEMADVYAFMLELMVIVGYTADDVHDFSVNVSESHNLQAIVSNNRKLESLFDTIKSTMTLMGLHPQRNSFFELELDTFKGHNIYSFGNRLSIDLLKESQVWQHNIITELMKATRLLKAKPWKLKYKEVNLKEFKDNLLSAFTVLIGYTIAMGGTQESIYHNYISKNLENLERIKNEY
jgi:NTP pyrophosphatase (non-canonical NTP hydrolase)